MADCIFCRIACGEVPANVAYQDEEIVAFHDLAPQAPTHLLLVPREHLSSLAAAGAEHALMLGRLIDVARRLGDQLGLAANGYRLVVNTGRDGGQSVDHLHVHLLGGRPMGWPPG